VVFAVIVGTGCGGGLVVDGRIVEGANGVGGEWGHTPLPWPSAEEQALAPCWCGRPLCMELFVSGPGLEADYRRVTGRDWRAPAIMAAARSGDEAARAAFDRWADRLGRGLAVVADVCDPDVFVFGGGLSNLPELYDAVPPVLGRWLFSDVCETRLVPALHGDSSGVRGAAWLWPA
jgi:fructokinase